MNNDKQNLIKAIKILEDAFINLDKVWSEGNNREIMTEVHNNTGEYPFSRSFDELTRDVMEWSYWTRKDLGQQID